MALERQRHVTDLVVRGGLVVDGTGAPARRADVAVEGDRIVAVGDDLGRGRRELRADGLVVTPGWVDVHTHYDAQVTWDPQLSPSGGHGVTTVVMGNCGVGFAPAAPDRHDWLIGLMEGVEDIPGAALHEGIEWGWETFPEYLDALAARRWVADVGTQVPHGALRAYVMGDRGAADAPATEDELAAMARLVGEALAAGALGFSTSRTPLHRSVDGELVPGTRVAPAELFTVADALAAAGHGVFQGAFHHPQVPATFPVLRQVAARTGRPVLFNFSQTDQAPDLWRDVVALLDRAADDGLPVLGQVGGRPVGVLMGWDTTIHPFVAHPAFAPLRDLPPAARYRRLVDPAVRAALLAETPAPLGRFETFLTTTFAKMWPFRSEADYEPAPGGHVAALAAAAGRPPLEVAYDLLCADDGRGLLYFPLFNYSDGSLDVLHTLHGHGRTVMGLADAGAHCGAICDGGMPTFMVTHWTRDRTGDRFPLEHVVRRQTSATAAVYGLHDRGVVAPGYRADLNVLDLGALGVERPRVAWDLPGGARRFVQGARGYRATLCAGAVTVVDDEPTGELPGRLLRGPRPRPLVS
jgi:N-acyl-D-amino-acid deacylase